MINYNNLKTIAQFKIKRSSVSSFEEFEEFLREWWSEKYHLPNNHPLLLEKNLEELIIEYFVDYFKNNPQQLNEFEVKNNLLSDDDDEKWFKQKMGNQYSPKNAFSSDLIEDEQEPEQSSKVKNEILIDEKF